MTSRCGNPGGSCSEYGIGRKVWMGSGECTPCLACFFSNLHLLREFSSAITSSSEFQGSVGASELLLGKNWSNHSWSEPASNFTLGTRGILCMVSNLAWIGFLQIGHFSLFPSTEARLKDSTSHGLQRDMCPHAYRTRALAVQQIMQTSRAPRTRSFLLMSQLLLGSQDEAGDPGSAKGRSCCSASGCRCAFACCLRRLRWNPFHCRCDFFRNHQDRRTCFVLQ